MTVFGGTCSSHRTGISATSGRDQLCADLEHLAAIVEAETRRAAARDAPAAHSASLARAARMLVLSEKQVSVVGRERA